MATLSAAQKSGNVISPGIPQVPKAPAVVAVPKIATPQQIPNFNTPGITPLPAPKTTAPITFTPPVVSNPITPKATTPAIPAQPLAPAIPANRLTSQSTDANGNIIHTATTVTGNSLPYLNADGTLNSSYKPNSDSDLSSFITYANNSGNTDFQNAIPQITANYYGINTQGPNGANFGASTPQEQINLNNTLNQEQSSYLDQQIAASKAKAQATETGNVSAVNAGVGAVNREGVQSTGNQLTAQQTVGQFQATLNTYSASLDNQKLQLQNAQASGNAKLVDTISKGIAATTNAMIATQQSQANLAKTYSDMYTANGALVGMTPDQLQQISNQTGGVLTVPYLQSQQTAQTRLLGTSTQQIQFDQQTKALSAVQSMVGTGTSLTPEMADIFAKETGLSADQLLKYNTAAQAIMSNNKLDPQVKQAQLDQLNNTLSNEHQGFYTDAAKNIQGLIKLTASGASQDIIDSYKSATGITDYNDPITQAKLQAQQIENTMKTNEANGIAVTPADIASLANARATLVNAGLDPAVYLPPSSGSGYSVLQTANGIQIQGAVNGTTGGQCGHFVNQVLGTQVMPDSFAGKMAQTDPSIKVPTPGDFFVATAPGSAAANGHTGIVTSVDYQTGMMTIQESNYTTANKIDTRTVPISYASGFGHPPNATAGYGSQEQPKNMSNDQIRSTMAQYGNPNPSQKDINEAKMTNFINGYSTQGKQGVDTVLSVSPTGQSLTLQDYINPTPTPSGYQYIDTTNLSASEKASVDSAARANNIALLNSTQIDNFSKIQQGLGILQQITQTLRPHLPTGFSGGASALNYLAVGQNLGNAISADPDLTTYRDTTRQQLISLMNDVSTGTKFSSRLIRQVTGSVPNINDNTISFDQKVKILQDYLNNSEKALITENGGTLPSDQSTKQYSSLVNSYQLP